MTGRIYLKEQTTSGTDTATYGQLWVKDDTPNTLWFTDDAGNDFPLGVASYPTTGTILAASGAISDRIDTAPVFKASASVGATTNQWYTVWTTSGEGLLTFLAVYPQSTDADTFEIRVTIDGATAFSASAAGVTGYKGWVLAGSWKYDATYGIMAASSGQITFKSSILVEARRTTGSGTNTFYVSAMGHKV